MFFEDNIVRQFHISLWSVIDQIRYGLLPLQVWYLFVRFEIRTFSRIVGEKYY